MGLLYYSIFNTDADLNMDIPRNITDSVIQVALRAGLYAVNKNRIHMVVLDSDESLYHASVTTKRAEQANYKLATFTSFNIHEVIHDLHEHLRKNANGIVIFVQHNNITEDAIKAIMKTLKVKRKQNKYFEIKELSEHEMVLR